MVDLQKKKSSPLIAYCPKCRSNMSSKQPKYEYVSTAKLPTRMGDFKIHGFVEASGQEHVALSYGEWKEDDVVPIRIHSECLTGDSLFSTRCDCGFQLEKAMQNIVDNGHGVLLYLRQEGRGIGLLNKIRATDTPGFKPYIKLYGKKFILE